MLTPAEIPREVDRAYVNHRLPGRMRLKIPSRRGDRAFFADLGRALEDCPAVLRAEATPVTASVLILHEGEIEDVIKFARDRQLFSLDTEPQALPALIDRLRRGVEDVDRGVKSTTAGELDLAAIAFLVLVGLSVVQLMRGNILVPAVTAAWYAAGALAWGAARGAGPQKK